MSNKRIIDATFMLVVILFAWWLYSTFWPFNPLTVTGPLSVDKIVVHQGEAMSFKLNAIKHMDIVPDVTIELVNGVSHTLISYNPTNPPGDVFPYREIIIPYTAQPKKYRIKFGASYPIHNQRIKREAYSDWIAVLPRLDEKGEKGDRGERGYAGPKGQQGKAGGMVFFGK